MEYNHQQQKPIVQLSNKRSRSSVSVELLPNTEEMAPTPRKYSRSSHHNHSNWVNCNGARTTTSNSSHLTTSSSSLLNGSNLKKKISSQFVAFRKRPPVYKNWKRIGVFDNPNDAEQTQASYEGYTWGKRQRRETKDGLNIYFRCRGSSKCPVFLYLRYHNDSSQVYLYRTQNDHVHEKKIISVTADGLVGEVDELCSTSYTPTSEDLDRICYSNWKRKSSEVEQELIDVHGFTHVNKEELVAVLRRVRHEYGYDAWNSDEDVEQVELISSTPSATIHHHVYAQQLVQPILEDDEDDDEVVILPTTNNNFITGRTTTINPTNGVSGEEEQEAEIEPHCIVQGSNQSDNVIFMRKQKETASPQLSRNKTTITPISESWKLPNSDNRKYNASISSTTKISTKFACRDESKEQGEVCLPEEDNIKAAVLKYIDENYSNRDILHIREELRILRREKKYPIMNRLFSFTAGFLQDSFLGHHLEENKKS